MRVAFIIGVEPLGDAAPWIVVEPPSLSLFPGGEQQVLVRFVNDNLEMGVNFGFQVAVAGTIR